MMLILVNCGCCGVASGYGCAVWCTYGATTAWCTRNCWLYSCLCVRTRGATHVRTVNGFVLPRDRGLEYASPKYRRRNSVIIIASLREYKRAPAMPLPTLTWSHQLFGRQSVTSVMFWLFSILFSIVLHRVLVQHDRRSVLSWFSLFFRFGLNEFSIWFISTSCFVLRLNVDCFWFCFGSVLAFDLLPYSLGSGFCIVFGLFYCFGLHSVFSFGFGLCLVLFVVFGFCFDFNWFRFRFRAGSFTVPLFGFSVPFSNVLILVCFVFRSG